jgi:hypothetical protein
MPTTTWPCSRWPSLAPTCWPPWVPFVVGCSTGGWPSSTSTLATPATALVTGHLEDLGVSFSGIFPNSRADGDVPLMQSLNGITITTDDVAVASDHGKHLLAYVLSDLITAAS